MLTTSIVLTVVRCCWRDDYDDTEEDHDHGNDDDGGPGHGDADVHIAGGDYNDDCGDAHDVDGTND